MSVNLMHTRASTAEADEIRARFSRLTEREAEIVDQVEQQLAKPVTSSNHALIWHTLRLAGVKESIPGFGMLYHLPADPA